MSKQRLLVLHGALGSAKQLQSLCDKLDATFDVHSFNFSGHGGRAFETNFSIDQFATDLKSYIEENKLEGIDIFGYSMGGYVALRLALIESNLISKIHTLGTKFGWSPETAAKEVKMLNPEKIEEKVPAFAKVLSERHAPNDWKDVLLNTKQMMLALGAQPVLSQREYQQITNDVIIGIGSEDSMVSIEESELVANHLPHGQLQVFEGFKHPIEQIDCNILAESIEDFCNN